MVGFLAGPLESIRVLDLTRLLPGPYCTMFLADFGAEVIKIEEPKTGDYARWNEPQMAGQGAMFNSVNRNKKSVTINLKSQKGRDIFLELVKTADVLVESFRPGVMDRLALGYEQLKELHPKLIYCSISGYGQDGPLAHEPGHDLNYLAYSGLLDLQGERTGKPIIPSTQIADLGGGALMAAVGILISIVDLVKTGSGKYIDISMLDGLVSMMQTIVPDYLANQQLPNRGELLLNGGKAYYQVYETKDNRFISVGAIEPKFWEEFCKAINKESLISQYNGSIVEQRKMIAEIQEIMIQKSLEEWVSIFDNFDTCVAPVLTTKEMIKNKQIIHREMITQVNHPEHGEIKYIGNPIKLSDTEIPMKTSPGLGEHTFEEISGLGYSQKEIQEFIKEKVL
ncbi:MAG: carnitine dehydratase [Neobacillus sp.]|nr:carnitine dehydratase [Neobacillus sp.]